MRTIITAVLITWTLIALVLAAGALLGRFEFGRKLVSYPASVLLLVPVGGLMGMAFFQILFLVDPGVPKLAGRVR